MSKIENNSIANMMAYGQLGSCFTDANSQVTPPAGQVIVAIQFIDSTTFDELSPVGDADGICVGDDTGELGAGTGGTLIGAAGDSDLTLFPEGVTIFGRWKSFTIDAEAGGGVIAYFGP